MRVSALLTPSLVAGLGLLSGGCSSSASHTSGSNDGGGQPGLDSGNGTDGGGSGDSGGSAEAGADGGAGSSLAITTSSLPGAIVGSPYTQTLAAAGGSGGYVWSQVSAAPNSGLWTYVTPGGTASGTPEMAETETVTYQVTDSAGHTAQKTLTFDATATGALAI